MTYARVLLMFCLHPMTNSVTRDKPDLEDFRVKRQINSLPLVFPYGATYKLLVGFALPVPSEYGLIFAVNFQYQYLQFQNISELSQYYFIKEVSREQRDTETLERKNERLFFYKSIADMLFSKGMNGLDCVLRAICEAAQYPVKEEGLVGELLHILFTPDYGRTPFDDNQLDFDEELVIYKDAAVAGRQMFDCVSIYQDCPEGQGIMEFISKLQDM